MGQIGYAVVGTGYFGAELARILDSLPGASVSAVYDPVNADALARQLGCHVETDLSELIARADVQAVIVASPNHLHKDAVMAAAAAGVHILCEKPIALSYRDCDDMVTAAARSGVVFMAGHIMNFFDGVRRAKSLIDSGRIGRVVFAHSARNGWEEPKGTVSWKKNRATSGGHLYHHIHELDCIQFLVGPATRVTMTGGNVAHTGSQFGDEDDMLLLQLEFGPDCYGICEYGSAFHWPEHYVLIQGTEGAIRLDLMNAHVTLRTADGQEERFRLHCNEAEDADRALTYVQRADGAIRYGAPGDRPPLWLQGAMLEELTFFHELMLLGTTSEVFAPLLNGQAARAAIATADAATLSLSEGRTVAVAEITGAPIARSAAD